MSEGKRGLAPIRTFIDEVVHCRNHRPGERMDAAVVEIGPMIHDREQVTKIGDRLLVGHRKAPYSVEYAS